MCYTPIDFTDTRDSVSGDSDRFCITGEQNKWRIFIMISKEKKQEIIREFGRTEWRHRFTGSSGRYSDSTHQ